jgi:N-acetyl-anhydromuramyl-L-alanine amidase AmpD
MDPQLAARIQTDQTFPVTLETWPRPKKPTQVCLHHTASGPGTVGDITWWKRDGAPVSTPLVVDRNGTAVQIYSTQRWAYHLGLKNVPKFREVEAATIGLEIDSWGSLKLKDGKYISWTGAEVPEEEVCILKQAHRGCLYFHKYTTAQIETVKLLLQHWNLTYGILLDYKDQQLWGLSENAMNARVPGIYSHNSFRADKNDIHPQPEMVEMLKNLKPA